MRERRKAAERNYPDMSATDSWFEARDEVLVPQHRVERDRSARRFHVTHPPVDAGRDVGKQLGHFERHELPHRTHRVGEFLQLLLEALPLPLPAAVPGYAGDDGAPYPALHLRRP